MLQKRQSRSVLSRKRPMARLLLGEAEIQLCLCYEDKTTSWAIRAQTQIGQALLGNLKKSKTDHS